MTELEDFILALKTENMVFVEAYMKKDKENYQPTEQELLEYFHSNVMGCTSCPVSKRMVSRQWLWERNLLQYKPPITYEEWAGANLKPVQVAMDSEILRGKTIVAILKDTYSQAKWIQGLIKEFRKKHSVSFDVHQNTMYFNDGIKILFVIGSQAYDDRIRSLDKTNSYYKFLL